MAVPADAVVVDIDNGGTFDVDVAGGALASPFEIDLGGIGASALVAYPGLGNYASGLDWFGTASGKSWQVLPRPITND